MQSLSQRARKRLLFAGLVVGLGTLTAVIVATGRTIPSAKTHDVGRDRLDVRHVRVLVGASVPRFRVRAEGGITVDGDRAQAIGSIPDDDWIEVVANSASSITIADGAIRRSRCIIRPNEGESMAFSRYQKGKWHEELFYPGSIRIELTENRSMDLVNELDIERYVSCVVAREAWPTFLPAALRTQAIAARGYVLYQMQRRRNAGYDVSASQGSQVYRGERRDKMGAKAMAATTYTSGIVCTWNDGGTPRLFSTYYSAACGGASQSAAIFGEADNVPPLAGGVRCDFCRNAPGETYKWKPVKIKLTDLYDRLVKRYPDFKSLRGLRDIVVVDRTPHGRLVTLRLIGKTSDSRELSAENVRLAVGGSRVRSTLCDIELTRRYVTFKNGRGYGHGLGLCQWGAQGQALNGKSAAEILRFYYPGSRLTRAY